MNAQEADLKDCQIIPLEEHNPDAGDLVAIGDHIQLPFETKRIFYIYDIPVGTIRGEHAHKTCHELIVAASGAFTVKLDDGEATKEVLLDQPDVGLHIPPGIWASEMKFSGGAICLVLASHDYDEGDYIRDYIAFRSWKTGQNAAE